MGNKGLRYAVRDGFVNLGRHPLILAASITTMFLMLSLLGFFMLFAMNITEGIHQAGKQPPVEIQFAVGTSEELVRGLETQLQQNEHVVEVRVLSPEENLQDFQQKVGKSEFFEEFDYRQHIPWTILTRLDDPALGEAFLEETLKFPGVYDVLMQSALMQTLNQANRLVTGFSAVMVPILMLIVILIISNMIRLSALSRSTELAIMKTMGATNRYIRIPYEIEGAFVGVVASTMAVLVISLGYAALQTSFLPIESMVSLLPLSRVFLPVSVCLVGVALFVGVLTSALSIRRYIKV